MLYAVFELTNVILSVGDSLPFAVSLPVFDRTSVHPLPARGICHFDFRIDTERRLLLVRVIRLNYL